MAPAWRAVDPADQGLARPPRLCSPCSPPARAGPWRHRRHPLGAGHGRQLREAIDEQVAVDAAAEVGRIPRFERQVAHLVHGLQDEALAVPAEPLDRFADGEDVAACTQLRVGAPHAQQHRRDEVGALVLAAAHAVELAGAPQVEVELVAGVGREGHGQALPHGLPRLVVAHHETEVGLPVGGRQVDAEGAGLHVGGRFFFVAAVGPACRHLARPRLVFEGGVGQAHRPGRLRQRHPPCHTHCQRHPCIASHRSSFFAAFAKKRRCAGPSPVFFAAQSWFCQSACANFAPAAACLVRTITRR